MVEVRWFAPGAIFSTRNSCRLNPSFRYVTVIKSPGRIPNDLTLVANSTYVLPRTERSRFSFNILAAWSKFGIPNAASRLGIAFRQRETVLLVFVQRILKLHREQVGCVRDAPRINSKTRLAGGLPHQA